MVRDDAGVGSLKLIVAEGDGVEPVLRERVRDADLRALAAGAWVAYTEAEPAEIRDWLADGAGAGGVAFVVEFERWSSYGEAIERAWLLRRGH